MQPTARHTTPALTDGDLVCAAQRGEIAALGLLLERHRPHLFATALRLVGYRAEAEDAVQETCLVAMRHIGSVRDPASVGAWLHVVVRRACLQYRRRRTEVTSDALPEIADDRASPADRIERLELRDWIWTALQRLPESLRVTAMLRYFGSYDSYDEVAAILGVPIGTVRSRLAEVRNRLADALLASAGLIDDDVRTRAHARARFWTEAFDGISRRGESAGFISHFTTDLLLGWSNGHKLRGRHHLAREINGDLEAGVRLDVTRVMTHGGIAVVEGRFVNPPENPAHCPPGIGLVIVGDGEKASGVRLHLAPRAPRPPEE